MTLQFNNFSSLLKQSIEPSGYLVALSGGLDSMVLLALMHKVAAQTKIPLRAIHINHGLQSDADQWEIHCQQQCTILQIPLKIVHLNIAPVKGESIEATAREQRYQAFASELQQDESLLLAQHRDDQAETLLLQLLRGAGPEGLASMPMFRKFARGTMFRPLLDSTRKEIEEYAKSKALIWIEDPSNNELNFDRNYLRHKVMPLIEARWPSYSKTFSRSASLCADGNHFISTQAAELLSKVILKNSAPSSAQCEYLIDINLLSEYSSVQQALLVREWLKQLQLARPSEIQMQELLKQMLQSNEQASPLVKWGGVEVRRYRKHLYAFETPPMFDFSFESQWNLNKPLLLPDIFGYLVATEVRGAGICKSKIGCEPLIVSFRHETPKGCDNSPDSKVVRKILVKPSTLKKIMQQSSIPPWERNRVIVLSNKIGDLIALVGWWISPDYQVVGADEGYNVHLMTELCRH